MAFIRESMLRRTKSTSVLGLTRCRFSSVSRADDFIFNARNIEYRNPAKPYCFQAFDGQFRNHFPTRQVLRPYLRSEIRRPGRFGSHLPFVEDEHPIIMLSWDSTP